MITDKWFEYGMGMFALAAFAAITYKLIEWRMTRPNGTSSTSPPLSTPTPEIIAALNRNSDAITRLTQLLELQFEFEKERRAEDRARIEKLQETADEILRKLVEHTSQSQLATEALKAEIVQNIGKLRADLRIKGD